MPVYTDANRRGLPAPLSRSGAMQSLFGQPGQVPLVKIKLPLLGTVQVHKRAAPAYEAWFGAMERTGVLSLIDVYDFGGTYCLRRVRSGSSYSPHSWGVAIDLNVHHLAPEPPCRAKSEWNYHCAPSQIAPCLQKIADVALLWGFSWGGWWSSQSLDPMHFEATDATLFVIEGRKFPYYELFQERLIRSGRWTTAQDTPLQVVKVQWTTGKLIGSAWIVNGMAWAEKGALELNGFPTDGLPTDTELVPGLVLVPLRRAVERAGHTVYTEHISDQRKIYIA